MAVAHSPEEMVESDLIVSNFNTVQTVLELCLEKLPPLLELGRIFALLPQDYDFPYNRPSLLSNAQMEEMHMPESIAYAAALSTDILLIFVN